MTDILSQTKPLGEMDPVSEQAPIPTETDQEGIVTAAWRNGHAKGWHRGYKMGFSNGKSTLGRQWFFIVAMAFFLFGGILGGFMDFITTCGPEIPCGLQLPEGWGFAPLTVEQPNVD